MHSAGVKWAPRRSMGYALQLVGGLLRAVDKITEEWLNAPILVTGRPRRKRSVNFIQRQSRKRNRK